MAVQMASSMAMRALDKATSDAYEAYLLKDDPPKSITLKDTEPDDYWVSFVTSGFSTMEPVSEPLPQEQPSPKQPNGTASMQTASTSGDTDYALSTPHTRLVRVELWNLLIGDEKQSILEKARLIGATGLPPANEWPRWQIATGSTMDHEEKPITFLIPPTFGHVRSGDLAVVELAGAGELNVARYPASR